MMETNFNVKKYTSTNKPRFCLDTPSSLDLMPPTHTSWKRWWPLMVTRENYKIYKKWVINFFFRKSIPFFISFWPIHWSLHCKKYQYHPLLSSSSTGLYSWKSKTNYLSALHFWNSSYNYLHVLVMKMISHKKQMWQIWSKSDAVIWFLPREFGLVQVPVLSLRLLGCLTLALQNLPHKLISACISFHPNPIRFYRHPKWKTLLLEFFFFFASVIKLPTKQFNNSPIVLNLLLNMNNNFI